MHYLVCNSCVEKWDHHCFWINTCINENNQKQFDLFFYSMMNFVFLNILFFLLNIYIWFNKKTYHKLDYHHQLFHHHYQIDSLIFL